MDFSFTELNFNSVETLPGFESRAAFTVNSSSVFKEDVDIVRLSLTIHSLTFRGAATIRCRSTCSRSSRKMKLWQPASASTPRSATGRGCNAAPPKPPLRSSRLSKISYLTTTSPHTFSASVRTSSTSASPYRCLFSTRTACVSSAC